MNRRNLLVSIGTAAVGTGAVLGSGALTSVSADRSFSVATADDSNAKIQLSTNATLVSTETGTNGQTILNFDLSNLNDDATTTINPAFTITNAMSDGVGVRVRALDSNGSEVTSGIVIEDSGETMSITSYPTANGDPHNLDPSGGSDAVDVKLELDSNNDPVDTITTLQIEASTDKYIV